MKRKNIGLIIALILFIILTLALGAYIAYDKFLTKNTEDVSNKEVISNEEEPEEIQTEKITLVEVNDLLDSYRSLIELNQKSNLNELTNQEKLSLALEVYLRNNNNNANSTIISATDLEDAYFIAGELEHEDISDSVIDEIQYFYNSDSKTYELNEDIPGHGGGAYIPSGTYNYDFYEEDGNYILIRYGVFNVCPETGPCSDEYYGKFKDVELDNALFKNPYEFESANWEVYDPTNEIKENFAEYENEITKFTYTFQKTDGKIMLIDYKAE